MSRYKIKTSLGGDFEINAKDSWEAIHQFIWNSIIDHTHDRGIDYGEIVDVSLIETKGADHEI